jgi:arylsulfatase A-like enzyme
MGTKGHSSSAGLRGVKSTRWEGGHRVPLIVKWPDKIPAGKITSSIVNFTDFMATFAELFQVNLLKQFPSAVDSYSFLPALFDERTMMNRPAMVHRSNAIRSGQFKLIHPNHFTKFENTKISEFELYDLDGDRREMKPLSNHRLKNKLFEEYQRFNRQRKFK